MSKHIHIHLTHDAGTATSETKTKNGVTTWGASDPKKALDAGTSEGAKKAAETRKRGGGTTWGKKPDDDPTPFVGMGKSKTRTPGGRRTPPTVIKSVGENYTKRQTTEKGKTIVKHSDAGTIDWLDQRR